MRRLMTHLAQFSSFSKQGEILCTRGLEFLLQNVEACEKFTDYLAHQCGTTFCKPLEWRAESRQNDLGRPDLEACGRDLKPVIKIEAKLGAAFREGQLLSYAADLLARNGSGLVVVVVPRYRADEVSKLASNLELPQQVKVCVVTWDDILELLATLSMEAFAGDLLQFTAMYRALIGDDIEPFATNEVILAWREREDIFINLVDRASRRLRHPNPLLPMALDKRRSSKRTDPNDLAAEREVVSSEPRPGTKVPRGGYLRRYICRWIDEKKNPCFSLGVRDPFDGFVTPVWLRFHKETPAFSFVRGRLRESTYAVRLVEWEGHVWIPLDVPLNADAGTMIDSLVEQTESIWKVLCAPELN